MAAAAQPDTAAMPGRRRFPDRSQRRLPDDLRMQAEPPTFVAEFSKQEFFVVSKTGNLIWGDW
jgi:hypothetical protein